MFLNFKLNINGQKKCFKLFNVYRADGKVKKDGRPDDKESILEQITYCIGFVKL